MSPSRDTWSNRDLPVLAAVVDLVDEHQFAADTDLAALTELDEEYVQRALRALAGDRLIQHAPTRADGSITLVTGVTGEARRRAGAWPTVESAADRMITALEQIAENGTEQERSRAQKVLGEVRGAGRQILISVAAAAITGQVA